MSPFRFLTLKFAVVLCATQMLFAEPEPAVVVDPFSVTEDPEKEPEKPVKFETTFGFSVKPFDQWPRVLMPSQWPRIEAPTTFNSHFEKPETVWEVDGGYLASFNGGEFGSALFYADRNGNQWTRILAEPVEHCVQVKGDRFLLSGGLGHLDTVAGKVFFLERTPDGKWSSKKVLESDFGIPTLIGESRTRRFGEDPEERLFVISFEPDGFNKNLLGIDGAGAVYPLGEKAPAENAKTKSEPDPGIEKAPAKDD